MSGLITSSIIIGPMFIVSDEMKTLNPFTVFLRVFFIILFGVNDSSHVISFGIFSISKITISSTPFGSTGVLFMLK